MLASAVVLYHWLQSSLLAMIICLHLKPVDHSVQHRLSNKTLTVYCLQIYKSTQYITTF